MSNLLKSAAQVKNLGKNHAKFNELLQKIEKLKEETAEIKANLEIARVRYKKKVLPLILQSQAKDIEIVHALNDVFDSFNLTKKEEIVLTWYLLRKLENIIEFEFVNKETVDESLKQLYTKFSSKNYAIFENTFLKKYEKVEEEKTEINTEQESVVKKKSKKEQVSEQKEKELSDNMKKDTRFIYTQLAKKIHPDTEQNPEQQSQKTEIMKRVTNAYSNDDIFELLKIQAEVELLSEENLAKTNEDLMASYVSILQKQAETLRSNMNVLTKRNPLYSNYFTFKGELSEKYFRKHAQELKESIEHQREVIAICKNKGDFKVFLKEIRSIYESENVSLGYDFDY